MKSILIDAGPLIALFDKSDQYHEQAVRFVRMIDGSLFTTWPVITECSHMLGFSVKAQLNLLEWVRRGGLLVETINTDELSRLITLVGKYKDVPMDLADASLIVLSERKEIKEIASIDSDFYIYRNIRNQYLTNVFI